MKKVLQVLGSLQRGGAETMVMNVYRLVNREEIQFDFLVKDRVNDGYEQEVEAMGGKIFCVSSPKKQGTINYINQVKNVIIENGPYVAVHSHMNVISGLIMLAAYFAGIKNRISHSHSTRFPNSRIINTVGKIMISMFATKKLACGVQAGNALFGKKDFEIVPNGIDTEKNMVHSVQERIRIQNDLNFEENKMHICHVGRFVEVKNHQFIIELAEQLLKMGSECVIHLLGDGELLDSIQKMAGDRNLDNLIFHGSVSNVADYLKASDVLILPSKYEGVPLSVIEAQCAGLMCYLSQNVPDEVDLGIGRIEYLPLNSMMWAEKINTYSDGGCHIDLCPVLADAIEKSGFDIHRSVDKLLKLY